MSDYSNCSFEEDYVVPENKSCGLNRLALIPLVLGLCLSLSSCVPAVVGAGAAVVAAGTSEKGIGTSASDVVIKVKINDIFLRTNASLFGSVSTSVTSGSVLLTGSVNTPEDKVEATRLVWDVHGVTEVLNELDVKDTSSLKDIAKDFAAGAQLRAKLIGDQNISSLNFSVDVVNGNVFLSGLASSEDEMNRVVEHARSLSFASEVTNYIRVNDDDRQ